MNISFSMIRWIWAGGGGGRDVCEGRCTHLALGPFAGLSSKPFQGFHDLQEVECSAESLPPDSDVMSMVLFHDDLDKTVLAAVNLKKEECSTAEKFVSCEIVPSDCRRSKLKALVDDLAEGQSRVYGCNVSALISGVRMQTFSWSVTVRRIISKHMTAWANSVTCMKSRILFTQVSSVVSPLTLTRALG